LRDEREFEDFYAAVFDRLVGQLYLVTGNLQDAEDVVQEALTRAAVRWSRLRRYSVPEAWVRRVAMNLASDGFRRVRRRLAVAVRLRADLESRQPVPAELPGLTEALRALPMAQRKVVVLHHVLDLPVDQVAVLVAGRGSAAGGCTPCGFQAARHQPRPRRTTATTGAPGGCAPGSAGGAAERRRP
jgi:RNA polymerase sigma-70 factor, ECF subfamily